MREIASQESTQEVYERVENALQLICNELAKNKIQPISDDVYGEIFSLLDTLAIDHRADKMKAGTDPAQMAVAHDVDSSILSDIRDKLDVLKNLNKNKYYLQKDGVVKFVSALEELEKIGLSHSDGSPLTKTTQNLIEDMKLASAVFDPDWSVPDDIEDSETWLLFEDQKGRKPVDLYLLAKEKNNKKALIERMESILRYYFKQNFFDPTKKTTVPIKMQFQGDGGEIIEETRDVEISRMQMAEKHENFVEALRALDVLKCIECPDAFEQSTNRNAVLYLIIKDLQRAMKALNAYGASVKEGCAADVFAIREVLEHILYHKLTNVVDFRTGEGSDDGCNLETVPRPEDLPDTPELEVKIDTVDMEKDEDLKEHYGMSKNELQKILDHNKISFKEFQRVEALNKIIARRNTLQALQRPIEGQTNLAGHMRIRQMVVIDRQMSGGLSNKEADRYGDWTKEILGIEYECESPIYASHFSDAYGGSWDRHSFISKLYPQFGGHNHFEQMKNVERHIELRDRQKVLIHKAQDPEGAEKYEQFMTLIKQAPKDEPLTTILTPEELLEFMDLRKEIRGKYNPPMTKIDWELDVITRTLD